MIVYKLLHGYVSFYLWIKSWFITPGHKSNHSFIKDYETGSIENYDFCLFELPSGKVQILKQIPESCSYQFISCVVLAADGNELSLSLNEYHLQNNVLDKRFFKYLTKKTHNAVIDEFVVEIWDHKCMKQVLDPEKQILLFLKDEYILTTI